MHTFIDLKISISRSQDINIEEEMYSLEGSVQS